ncbi:DUF6273 domain-containing protein [Bifidobacterium amazonense]|uniref:DUF6273 domain-containing protein n=1 Tax=Bifidobacterium amazonense TaxID=2809027 RepID=A0ABS9VV39_9BIFI|nr:DUF6273 domain-containing protein [Bifidobacterium amazonense]MCH9275938.1 DUF6273 domain-containing protein [Bifidobacterium amazonense]
MVVIQTLYGSFKPAVPVTGVTLSKTAATLKTGESTDFTVTIAPDTASNKRFTVAVDKPDLVTLTKGAGNTYTVAAKEGTDGGTAIVTVTSKSNPAATAKLTITVRVPVTAITVDKPTVQGDTKTSVDVTFTVAPTNATDKTLVVTSSAPTIASVALKSGTTYTISYLKGGEATITGASKSDPTVKATVAVTSIQTGPTDDEKVKYYTDNLAKAKAGTYVGKEIKAGVELLEGWTPFDDTGKATPAEMVAAIAKAGDANINAIIPGDYFNVTAGGTTYKYVCNGRDQYYISGDATNGKHHFTFVPDKLFPTAMAYASSNSNDWGNSDLKKWMEGTFYNSLPTAVKNSIVGLKVPFTNYSGQRSGVVSKVFPPSEWEAFGKKNYSAETAGGTPPNNAYVVLSRSDANRKRTGANNWYWLRSAGSGRTNYVPIVYTDGTANVNYANIAYGAALPCFNLG